MVTINLQGLVPHVFSCGAFHVIIFIETGGIVLNIDKLLKQVEKPIRYTGEEINMCKKDLNNISFNFQMIMKLVCRI